jgi:hypothetical protein
MKSVQSDKIEYPHRSGDFFHIVFHIISRQKVENSHWEKPNRNQTKSELSSASLRSGNDGMLEYWNVGFGILG